MSLPDRDPLGIPVPTPEDIAALVVEYPVQIECSLLWGQLDSFQHLNNTVYFRFFEEVRIAYLERVGWLAEMERSGVGPILARTQCIFRYPLDYPDTVVVGALGEDIGDDRFSMRYRIVSKRRGLVAADGDGRVVSYDYRHQVKRPIPPTVRDAMVTLAERGGQPR